MEIALIFSGVIAFLIGALSLALFDFSWRSLVLALLGLGWVLGAFLNSPGRFLKGNQLKTAIGGVSALTAFAGFMTTLLAFMGLELMSPLWLWRILGLLMFGGGLFGVFYGMNYRLNPFAEAIGEALGFSPADTGLLRRDGNYNMKRDVGGTEVLLDIDQRPETRDRPENYFLDILCRVRNPRGLRLAVYPGSFLGLKRPFGFLPPRLKDVKGWEGCVRRGSPPAEAAELLGRAADGTREHSAAYRGLLYFKLEPAGLKFLFNYSGRPETDRVRKAIDAALALADLIDGRVHFQTGEKAKNRASGNSV